MSESPATPLASCPECCKLRAALCEARKQIADLQAQLHELRVQLTRNSSNSSSPLSADPPGAPKPVVKTPTGRKPGGQPGHQGHHRRRLPPERVNQIVPYLPTICDHCQALLPAEPGPGDPEPTWHQVTELPQLEALITEHQGHARTCSCCGQLNRSVIPPEIRAHSIGPRLTAVLS
jgi:transposase